MDPKTAITIASTIAKGVEILLKKDDSKELDETRHYEILTELKELNKKVTELAENLEDIYHRLDYIPNETSDNINLKVLQANIGRYQRILQDYLDNKKMRGPLKTRFADLLEKIQSSTEYIETNNPMDPAFLFVMASAMKADITLTKIYDKKHVNYLKNMYLEYFNRILTEGLPDINSPAPIKSLLAAERERISPYIENEVKEFIRTIDVPSYPSLQESIKEHYQEAQSVPYVKTIFKVKLDYQENEEIEKMLQLGIISPNERYTSFEQTFTEKYCEWYNLRISHLQEVSKRHGISNTPLKRYEVTHKQIIRRILNERNSEYQNVIPLTKLYLLASLDYVAKKSIEFLNRL